MGFFAGQVLQVYARGFKRPLCVSTGYETGLKVFVKIRGCFYYLLISWGLIKNDFYDSLRFSGCLVRLLNSILSKL